MTDAIDDAIDQVEHRRMQEELAKLDARQAVRIPILTEPHTWTGEQEVLVEAIPGDTPTFLMWDAGQGAFRAVILRDDTSWRIVPDRPALWTPGGQS